MYSTRQKLAMYFGVENTRKASIWDELEEGSDLMAAEKSKGKSCGKSSESRFTKALDDADRFKGVKGEYGNYQKHHEYGETGFGDSNSKAYKKKYNAWYMDNVFDGECP